MKKPEYMLNLTIQPPKFEESMGFETSITHKMGVAVAENFDDAVSEKIIDIAKEEGFNSLVLLNKKDIASALSKQIPEKGNIHGIREGREINTVSYTCPVCHNHIGRDNYCKHCGQRLEWGDTDE